VAISSFFGKLVAPEQADSGNWNMSVLTVLVGLAFAISVVGTVASVAIRGSARGHIDDQR
jgi:hypothetical protein